ncbi:MAG: hypothetical protein KDG54_11240 [Geminicoccaceae bacterium]|nr:hypothetical protein [Geminicoccaceae bacterium]
MADKAFALNQPMRDIRTLFPPSRGWLLMAGCSWLADGVLHSMNRGEPQGTQGMSEDPSSGPFTGLRKSSGQAEDRQGLSDGHAGAYTVVPSEFTADPQALDRQVTELAFKLTVRALEDYGNELSKLHRQALRDCVDLFTRVASGETTGRHVLDLPTGLGKTTAMVCWVKAMMALPTGWSVAIGASRIKELCDIHDGLVSGDEALPEHEIGLWYLPKSPKAANRGDPDGDSDPNDDERPSRKPTFLPKETHRYRERRVLLLTHQRVRQGERAIEQLRFQDGPRNLVIYDESLLTTEPVRLDCGELRGRIEKVFSTKLANSRVAKILNDLRECLVVEADQQENGGSPRQLELGSKLGTAADVQNVQAVVNEALGRPKNGAQGTPLQILLNDFIDYGPKPGRLLVIDKEFKNAEFIYSKVRVLDEIDRMVVLDASWPLCALMDEAMRRLPKDKKHLGLKPLAREGGNTITAIKHYKNLEIHWTGSKASGRGYLEKDFGNLANSKLLPDITKVIRQIAEEEAILIWVFKAREGRTDNRRQLEEYLKKQGVDIDAEIDLHNLKGTERKRRIVIRTFGQETADNAYSYCTNVIFAGCMELPKGQLTARLLTESRDLLADVPGETADLLVSSDVHKRIYQAISRAACRKVYADEEGHTQAEATRVWLICRHDNTKERLRKVFPGAVWNGWASSITTKIERAAEIIRQILVKATGNRVSIRSIKRKLPGTLKNMGPKHFQKARDEAIRGTEWYVIGQSLVR